MKDGPFFWFFFFVEKGRGGVVAYFKILPLLIEWKDGKNAFMSS